MELRATEGEASRFEAYIDHLRESIDYAASGESLTAYCAGPLTPGERKSVELMAARLTPGQVGLPRIAIASKTLSALSPHAS